MDLKQLKEFLEEQRKDCLNLKSKDDLTDEGKGMLTLLNLIFEKMKWN